MVILAYFKIKGFGEVFFVNMDKERHQSRQRRVPVDDCSSSGEEDDANDLDVGVSLYQIEDSGVL